MLKLTGKVAVVAFGALVAALGLSLFLVPARIAPGGVSGISTVIHHLTGISVGVLIIIINIPIFILGFFSFGKNFTIWSVIGTLALAVLVSLFEWGKPITEDLVLASVFGGGMLGVGLGIVIRAGASTGGTDIVSRTIYKYYPAVSTGQFVMLVDVVVITFAGIVFQQWEIILYSGIALIVSSYMIDAVVEGIDFAKAAYIISEKKEEIAKYILDDMKRGVTELSGFSPYTDKERNMMFCIIKKHEINKLKTIIKEIDPNAFVILSDVREVLGEGFKGSS